MIRLFEHHQKAYLALALLLSFAGFGFAWMLLRNPGLPASQSHGVTALTLVALLAAYLFFIVRRRSTTTIPPLTTVLLGTVLLSIPLVLFSPLGSTDLYANAYYGRLITVHHFNPYTISSATTIHDVYFTHTLATAPFQSTYGPAWLTFTALVTSVTGEHIALTLTVFRLLNLAALLAITALLWSLPARNNLFRWAVLCVAWNPLVLFEAIQNGHNDVMMLLCVVAALVAYEKRRAAYVLPLLLLGGLIKFVPWILLPLACVAIWRRPTAVVQRAKTLLLSSAISVALLAAAFLPYWSGWHTFRELFLLGKFFALPPYHPIQWLSMLFHAFGATTSLAHGNAHVVGIALVVLGAIVLFVRLQKGTLILSTAAFILLTLFLFFGIVYIQPWYFLWLLLLIPLLPERQRVWALVLATSIPLVTYPFFLNS
ncbi:MAG: hypothetical protein V1778_04095 [bacterium]